MIYLEYLRNLLSHLQDENLPVECRLAVGTFVLCFILLLSFLNIITYFTVIICFDHKLIQEKMNKWIILKKFLILYKTTRIYFLVFEILLFLSINIFILWNCYRIFSFYIL